MRLRCERTEKDWAVVDMTAGMFWDRQAFFQCQKLGMCSTGLMSKFEAAPAVA